MIALPIPQSFGQRPPIDIDPRVGYSMDPDDEDPLAMHVMAVESLERRLKSEEIEPQELGVLALNRKHWVEQALSEERSIQPHILPPGVGILYSIDELLSDETPEVRMLLNLIDRLDDVIKECDRRHRFNNMIGDIGKWEIL